MIPLECVTVSVRDVTRANAEELIGLLKKMAEKRGERVILIPPAQGGWEVQVGTTQSYPQESFERAVSEAAIKQDVAERKYRAAMVTVPEFGSREEGGA